MSEDTHHSEKQYSFCFDSPEVMRGKYARAAAGLVLMLDEFGATDVAELLPRCQKPLAGGRLCSLPDRHDGPCRGPLIDRG